MPGCSSGRPSTHSGPRAGLEDGRAARAAGWGLIGVGLSVVGWTIRTVGEVDVERPAVLVTSGPFAYSRDPMYLAWTALYLGVAALLDAAWLLVALPFALVATHLTVLCQERSLERDFGREYRDYRDDVRRYL